MHVIDNRVTNCEFASSVFKLNFHHSVWKLQLSIVLSVEHIPKIQETRKLKVPAHFLIFKNFFSPSKSLKVSQTMGTPYINLFNFSGQYYAARCRAVIQVNQPYTWVHYFHRRNSFPRIVVLEIQIRQYFSTFQFQGSVVSLWISCSIAILIRT